MRYYSEPSGDNISNETESDSLTVANNLQLFFKGTTHPKMKILQVIYPHLELLCYKKSKKGPKHVKYMLYFKSFEIIQQLLKGLLLFTNTIITIEIIFSQ